MHLSSLFVIFHLHTFDHHFFLCLFNHRPCFPPFPYVFLFNLTFSYPSPLMSPPAPTSLSFLTPSHASLIQLGEETCTTSLPSCQQRTSIVPWAEGKTKIILFAEIHSRNISSGRGYYPQETKGGGGPCEDNDCNKCEQQNAFCNFPWFLNRCPYFEEKLPPETAPSRNPAGSKAVMTFLAVLGLNPKGI